jgi:energy-coupling factor transport system ATP-binding protein
VTVTHGPVLAVHDVSLALRPGTVTALMGRNGSGKSSLLWALQGSGRRRAGAVTVEGRDPAALDDATRRTLVGLVPQDAADLLYLETVDEELAASGATTADLARLVPGIHGRTHPRDLSEGQRLALALTVVLAPGHGPGPPVLLLDEPTRGLDYVAKHALARTLRSMAAQGAGPGRAVLVATHDVEFVAQVADQVMVLADGEVVSSGPVRRVVAESPAFAPQVTKVLGPPWLRVDEVVARL